MKHAFLIMAGAIDEALLEIIQQLDSQQHDFYIHIDLKAGIITEERVKKVAKLSNVKFIDRMNGTWGGFSLVRIELRLLRAAYAKHEYEYYHLLSGQDFPVKTNRQIDEFFAQNKGQNFLEVSDRLETQNPDRYRLRYQQYHFLQDRFVGKKRNIFKYIDFFSCYVQRYVGINRTRKISIQSGSQWFSINNDLTRYILNHEDWITKHFKYTYCCDELFIQSLISNTRFMKTLSENLRYVDFIWKSKHNLTPRYLTSDDLFLIEKPNYLFARKFTSDSMSQFRSRIQESESNL
ncbi:beta-1,6-N-acetylglucosaminyltransferase [Lacticaseibacillus paracasei]|uniref:beta-1,6-N-acetylglucosaminyltransferase n=2 Tax=Lacticaseibacillus paracasei TaxID=1597 RepID=UPI0002978E41|nr:beta-1,6-N-acetylglucosaminyltransferase [Lacticaseibacillus paracasei]EKQ05931.1 putative glycosyltransferase [Lacticaseibacillus paracasei]NMN62751.1 core-2/I-Branching enzyme [Lacticaseibacillus casei]NMN66591.1 core-2/I-Branching enzyme [Lacticaseibacillus casei CRF28]